MSQQELPTLVIVHLGPDPDRHVYANIKYLRKNFLNSLVVISNNEKLLNFCLANNVDFHIYERSKETKLLFESFVGDMDFREGYWFLTLERIFAFVEYQIDFSFLNLLQVESDVLLLKYFDFDIFAVSDLLSWTNVGPLHDCASLLYSPTPKTAAWLKRELVASVLDFPRTTDMLALRKIALLHSNAIRYLASDPHIIDQPFVLYDPLQFGMFIFGCDPRNLFGVIDRFVWWSEVGYVNTGFNYSTDFRGRIFLKFGNKYFQIQSIHNHSKNLLLFGRGQRLVIWFFIFTTKFSLFKKIPSRRFFSSYIKLGTENILNYRKYPLMLRTLRNIFFR